jgi:very-short-patch-repair endonuclease
MREFKFCPVRKWKADYAFPSVGLIVEIEGGAFSGGRHFRGRGAIDDMEKYNAAAILGYSILRFTPEQAQKLWAIRTIKQWFDARNGTPADFTIP